MIITNSQVYSLANIFDSLNHNYKVIYNGKITLLYTNDKLALCWPNFVVILRIYDTFTQVIIFKPGEGKVDLLTYKQSAGNQMIFYNARRDLIFSGELKYASPIYIDTIYTSFAAVARLLKWHKNEIAICL